MRRNALRAILNNVQDQKIGDDEISNIDDIIETPSELKRDAKRVDDAGRNEP
ncbi:hypothetical protein AAMO2058_001546100 [Amorphochlora amoebiformis]